MYEMWLCGRSLPKEDGLSWERFSNGVVESHGLFSGPGGQEIFCVSAAVPNEGGLHLTEFRQDLSLAQSLFGAKEGIGSVA